MKACILIIDDEKKLSQLLTRILQLEGYTVLQAATAKEGLKVLMQEDVWVIISDVKLPDASGVELVKTIKEKKPYTEVICLTAYGTIADGVTAMKNGAFDYITKGDDNDRILPLVSKAAEKAELQLKLFQLENKLIKRHSFDTIIGRSKPIKQAIDLAKRVSVTDTTVLLLGETGTGKEVFAQAIHYNSNRKQQNFVALNCSAFSAELLESELFGYKAGAFTSAIKDKKGLIEEADGGTLFLDEIGEMNIDLQAKLLRVLEAGEFIKLGQTKTQKVSIRIIAATNRNLEEEVGKGHFRRDLFYRLSIFTILLPSLNERIEDIPLLAEHYLKEFSAKVGQQVKSMEEGFIRQLSNHLWKGNIRELKNMIERAVIISDGKTLTVDLLPMNFSNSQPIAADVFDLSLVEKHHIQHVLRYTKGNKTEAARLLNIGLTTLYRKIDEYQLVV
ncbi:sigma-54-dependent Fis family transcriptional regulator [Mucilaginibacter robiniae]|uniref:Sigma-54-dependent Fis family transcriptional regulator n=1 Tax=Mucilaginibacter robiniae TaxID=2728022 RepID=A0A7L5E1D6_9SPHI|nr:sigma-54 dependent transcriptional regulator [Mucilaginibacter robiniae]QJD96995.1 sigma-54-dependent Fis family transcriptional regulator [Mucilaginibacter robiniae]